MLSKKNAQFCSHKCAWEGRRGKENSQWQGGKSFEPYTLEFNEKLKEMVRKRDRYRCQECFRHQNELYYKTGRKYRLYIHHINYDKHNNDLSNLISLCINCHAQTNFKRKNWEEYFRTKIRSYNKNGQR